MIRGADFFFSFFFLILCLWHIFKGSSRLTEGGADAVAFAVDESSHLCQITFSPCDVVDSGGLHNEGVVRLQYSLYAVLDGLHHRRAGFAAHEGPHLLKRGDLWPLKGRERESVDRERERLWGFWLATGPGGKPGKMNFIYTFVKPLAKSAIVGQILSLPVSPVGPTWTTAAQTFTVQIRPVEVENVFLLGFLDYLSVQR